MNLTLDNQRRKQVIIVLVAALTVLFFILLILILNSNTVQSLVMAWIFTTLYSIFAIIFTETKIKEVPKFIEKPVFREIIKEVPIQIPIENKTIEVIEKPVIQEVIKEVRVPFKPINKTKSRRKLNIPKYKFVGSKETGTFHKKSCRFGKLIKNKNKINANTRSYFKNRKFKTCKVCLNKSK